MKISMPRGDLRRVKFQAVDQKRRPVNIEFSEVYFTVKKTFYDEEFLFQKSLGAGTITFGSDGYYRLVIEPADTDNLEFGNYVFDIEFILGTSIKSTDTGDLILTYESTYVTNEGA